MMTPPLAIMGGLTRPMGGPSLVMGGLGCFRDQGLAPTVCALPILFMGGSLAGHPSGMFPPSSSSVVAPLWLRRAFHMLLHWWRLHLGIPLRRWVLCSLRTFVLRCCPISRSLSRVSQSLLKVFLRFIGGSKALPILFMGGFLMLLLLLRSSPMLQW
jgi:hypothetical protein